MNALSILYHGGSVEVSKPYIPCFGYNKDFAWGFYCTNSYRQAARWADRKLDVEGFVSKYKYTENSNLKILRFEEMTEEWLDFIVECRNGRLHDYDIVEGPMADDIIGRWVDAYLEGDIDREAFWSLAKFKHPTHQISFHTMRGISCISFVGSEVIA